MTSNTNVDRAVDVVIVGAGLAGLTAARRLRAAGATIRILESRARVGGRTTFMPELGHGYDAGGQFLHASYTQMLDLAADYGLDTAACFMEGSIVGLYGDRRSVVDNPQAYTFEDPSAAFQLLNARLRLHQMAQSLPPGAPWSAPNAAEWDAITFAEWTRSQITDPEARHVFTVSVSFDMMLGWENISLLGVLGYVRSVGSAKELGEALVLRDGPGGLAERIGAELADVTTLDAPVSSIRQTDDGVSVVSKAGTFVGRSVIVAMAPSLVNRIEMQPPVSAKRRLLQSLWVDGPSIKTVLVYDEPWWRDLGLAGYAITDRPAAAVVVDASHPDRPEGVLAVFSRATADMPEDVQDDAEARRRLVLDDLAFLFGEQARSPLKVGEANWYEEHWTAGAGNAPPPGLLSRFGAALRPAHGRVIWAGTETAEEFTGGMEGAVRSGERAAEEALAQCGIPSVHVASMPGDPTETLMVTGASGQLGRLVIDALLASPATKIVAGTRNPAEFANPAPDRVEVRRVDFGDPSSLTDGFAGVDRLLIISTDAVAPNSGRSAAQAAAVQAAVDAGVRHVVYTSMTRPEPGSEVAFAADHFATERALSDSPLSWTVLRNNSYMHSLLDSLAPAVATGWLMSAAGAGAVGYVTREDCAAAAAAALTSGPTDRAVYDITGPSAVSASELAALAGEISGKLVEVAHMGADQLRTGMTGFGLPTEIADLLVSFDAAAARGHAAVATTDFTTLTGRSATSVDQFLRDNRDRLIVG